MRRRRIDRSKRVIFGVFIFLCVLYIVLLILNLFSNNESSIKKQLEKDLIDDVAPTIELLGGEQRVAVHDKLVEPGYDVYDNVDFPDLEIESNVDTSSVGEYEIHYTAYDESGNSSSVTRKVSVIEPAGRIFLTFDDGPSEHTGVLLDVLKKYGYTREEYLRAANKVLDDDKLWLPFQAAVSDRIDSLLGIPKIVPVQKKGKK